jgi:hypothetical protein
VALDALGERLLDANRTIGQPNKITVIFGRKITCRHRGKLQTEIEDMHLPNPVIRSHYANGFIKQYVRDHLILRTEAATNNVNDYGVKKAVENLPQLRDKLSTINDNYQNIQQDILETFIDRGQLRQLAQPTILPNGKRIPGLKLDHPRQLAVMHALVRFAHVAAGSTFTTAEILPMSSKHLAVPLRLRPGIPALRPIQTQGQEPGQQAAPFPPISTPTPRLFGVSYLPQTLRAHLCTPHRRTAAPPSRRPSPATMQTITTGPLISAPPQRPQQAH